MAKAAPELFPLDGKSLERFPIHPLGNGVVLTRVLIATDQPNVVSAVLYESCHLNRLCIPKWWESMGEEHNSHWELVP